MDHRTACSVEGCDRLDVVLHSGFCQPHHKRNQRNGTPGDPLIQAPRGAFAVPRPECSVDGCTKPAFGRGMCQVHRYHLVTNGDPLVTRTGWRKTGKEHHGWREQISYSGIHRRLRKYKGRAGDMDCASCGAHGSQWAYNHDDPSPLLSEHGCQYSLDLANYVPLCSRCHQIFDALRPTKRWIGGCRRRDA